MWCIAESWESLVSRFWARCGEGREGCGRMVWKMYVSEKAEVDDDDLE